MLVATVGTRFYIGTARPAWEAGLVDAVEFGGETWIEVAGISSLGRMAGEWRTDVSVMPDWNDPDNPPMPMHEKTVRPTRTMQIVAGAMPDDPGQLAMLEAESSENAYGFRLVLPDGAQRMFIALVVAADDTYDEANAVVGWSYSLILLSNLVRS